MANRKTPKSTPEKKDTPFKGQYSNTGSVNRLSSDLNAIIQLHIGDFKRTNFYRRLQKILRKAQSDNRFVMLSQLKDMEINLEYPSKKYLHGVIVTNEKNNITVSIDVMMHPPAPRKVICNCYSYKVILLTWDKSDNLPKHQHQFSDWIDMDGGRPGYDFEFKKPEGTINWLLCIRQMIGLDKKRLGTFASESMYIAEIGTFDKKEQTLLEKTLEERSKKQRAINRESDEVERVKPKRMR